MSDSYLITATGLVRDEGTLVLLSGLTEDNREVVFACERRYAGDILDAVEAGEEPVAEVPSYMVTHIVERPHMPCLNVLHNEIDCHHLPVAEWCENCREGR